MSAPGFRPALPCGWRTTCMMPARHLSMPRVAARLKRSTPQQRASHPFGTCGRRSSHAGILDLATHKTCGTPSHGGARWALTPPFHPCPGGWWRRTQSPASPAVNGAVVFCHVVSAVARSFPLGSMALSVARTFLTLMCPQGAHEPATGCRTAVLWRKVTKKHPCSI